MSSPFLVVNAFLYYNRSMQKHTILASQSPRRRELLNLMGISFTTVNPNVDEVINPNLSLENAIEELAYIKALDVLNRHPEATIISADTIVVCEKEVLGKPLNEEDAIRMLKQLSGKKHEVITGVCILSTEKEYRFHTKTIVEFYEYDDEFVKSYVQSRVPLDKAGAYGIQDKGALLIKSIEGDYYTVMGLPIGELNQALKRFNKAD